MPAYMKLGDIKGGSQDARYPGWIAVLSWSNSTPRGSTDTIQVSKGADAASPFIFMAVAEGKYFKEVVLVSALAEPGTSYGYRLTEVYISSFDISAGVDQPKENLSLSFKSMEFLQEADLQKYRTVAAAKPGRKR